MTAQTEYKSTREYAGLKGVSMERVKVLCRKGTVKKGKLIAFKATPRCWMIKDCAHNDKFFKKKKVV